VIGEEFRAHDRRITAPLRNEHDRLFARIMSKQKEQEPKQAKPPHLVSALRDPSESEQSIPCSNLRNPARSMRSQSSSPSGCV